MKLKKFILTLLAILNIFILIGCHSNKILPDFKTPLEFDMDKEYNITFWAKNDTNLYQRKIYQDAVKEFNKYYPNIHVDLDDTYSDYGAIYNDVLNNIQTNTTPNVCITYIDHVATYNAQNELVIPLDDLIDDPNFGLGGEKLNYTSVKKEDVFSNYLDEGILNDKTYTLPFMRSTEVLYINEDYVKWLGYDIPEILSWDYVFEICQRAYDLRKEGKSPFQTLETEKEIEADLNKFFPFIYKSVDNQIITMLKQKGYQYCDELGNILMFNDDTKKILNYLADKQEDKLFNIFNIVSYPGNHFNIGNCIFAVDSTAGSTWMGRYAPLSEVERVENVDFKTVVRPIPQFDTENPVMISQGPSICIFNKENSDEVLASWIFANFLLTDYVQIRYSETEGYIPVTKSAVNNPSYQAYLNFQIGDDIKIFDDLISDKDIYDLEKETDLNNYFYDVKLNTAKLSTNVVVNTFIASPFNGSANLRTAAGKLVEKIIREASTKRVVTDEYIEKQYESMIQLYKLDMTIHHKINEVVILQEEVELKGEQIIYSFKKNQNTLSISISINSSTEIDLSSIKITDGNNQEKKLTDIILQDGSSIDPLMEGNKTFVFDLDTNELNYETFNIENDESEGIISLKISLLNEDIGSDDNVTEYSYKLETKGIVLLSILGTVWLIILGYVLYLFYKKKKHNA